MTSPAARTPDDAGASPIDFFFDFLSPFGWIGAEQVGAIARRFGRSVAWHPFLLKATVIEAMGLKPLLKTPLKGDYVLHDIYRSLRYHGMRMAPGAIFDFSSVPAARATLWVRATSPGQCEDLVLALYRSHWAEGRDISELDTILDLIEGVGLSRTEAAAALASEPLKTALREANEAAIGRGVFGSPTVIVDGEMFWGADRLPMVEAWLERGGW